MLVPVYADGDARRRQGHDQPAHAAEPRHAHRRGRPRACCAAGRRRSAASRRTSATRRWCRRAPPAIVEQLHVRATLDRVAQGPAARRALRARLGRRAGGVPRAAGASPGGDSPRWSTAARQRMRLAGMSDEQIALVESERQRAAALHDRRADRRRRRRADGARGHDGDAGRDAVPHQRPRHRLGERRGAGEPGGAGAARRAGRGAHARRCRAQCSSGKVQALLPEVNAATRTLQGARRARQSRRPAGAGHVRRRCSSCDTRAEKVLLVPTEAVIQTGKRNVVMLAEDDGTFRRSTSSRLESAADRDRTG